MNTKTNLQHASNSYNGDTVGRDSPSALLDMLAEVASQTLHSEKKRINSLLASNANRVECPCKPKTTTSLKRKELYFTVPQLLSMPVSHLVKQFTIFTSDELKRLYSYTCALVPGCQQKYTSFASEVKARTSVKNHLEEHLEYFKADKEAYDTFTAKSVNYKNLKTNLQNKKSRVQQTKKPQETLNKENKDVILEKSTNYLRKILLNDINIKEIEKQKCFQKPENKEVPDLKNSDQADFKVLGDHSYFERLDDKVSSRKGMSSLSNVLENTTREENIVLMVVGTDSVHMEEYSHVNQKLSIDSKCQDDSLGLPDLSWSDESRIRITEASTTTKPKGKAKFIGTSKEEREMALAYMERIKKKGNPTGSNLQCRICDPPRTFTAPTTLVSHYRSHAGIKPYECRICKAVFTRRHSLKYHMLIHSNQTRFTCTDCGKKFRHPSHFKEHQRRHTGEAPFGCDDCGQRFKTRNTYKRHLKTRHGKILTTTGELLHLPEEDFQKIRTNRRRKDYASETATNADSVASDTIVSFSNQHEHGTQVVEEYVLKENIDDINRNWETKETANNEEGHAAYEHNYDDEGKVYDCSEVIQSYTEVNCNSETSREEEEEDKKVTTQREVNMESLKGQDSYHKIIYNNAVQDESTTYMHLKVEDKANATSPNESNQIIIAQNDTALNEGHDKYADGLDIENKGCVENEIYLHSAQIANASVSILQTFNKVEEKFASQNQNMTLQQDERVKSDPESTATDTLNMEELNVSRKDLVAANEETVKQENKQYLYLHTGTMDDIIAQNKCINKCIPLHQINLYCDQHNQLKGNADNCKQIKVLNGDIRAINIQQSDKQNAILLVSNDSLQNGILKIDKGNITVKGVNR
ncbi:PREDICTED: zinc finger protein 37-like isoform X2 [Dinoponera quadriceps]|uniref:Zinc finger protein 37-like isoform X2 n=1 Tax=Dinoponera quadriceps TaxID=609295 RepID=A0A6P3XJR2_DINQU|nr:PREDICTED: zinc finger protein 37-like isoform X2 [Dinoponera quadriceps]